MAKMRWLSREGDSEMDCDTAEQIDAATIKFNELQAEGYKAFKKATGKEDYVPTKKFDPDAEETFLIPPIAGG